MTKNFSVFLLIFNKRRNRHQPTHANMLHFRNLSEQRFGILRLHAEFAFLRCHVHLNQNIHHNILLCRALFNFLRQLQAFHRMNHIHLINDIFHLVCLQMPN